MSSVVVYIICNEHVVFCTKLDPVFVYPMRCAKRLCPHERWCLPTTHITPLVLSVFFLHHPPRCTRRNTEHESVFVFYHDCITLCISSAGILAPKTRLARPRASIASRASSPPPPQPSGRESPSPVAANTPNQRRRSHHAAQASAHVASPKAPAASPQSRSRSPAAAAASPKTTSAPSTVRREKRSIFGIRTKRSTSTKHTSGTVPLGLPKFFFLFFLLHPFFRWSRVFGVLG